MVTLFLHPVLPKQNSSSGLAIILNYVLIIAVFAYFNIDLLQIFYDDHSFYTWYNSIRHYILAGFLITILIVGAIRRTDSSTNNKTNDQNE